MSIRKLQARIESRVIYFSTKYYDHAIQELRYAERLEPRNSAIKQLLADALRQKNFYR
jgi:cytochrome c-type biogenesis protein CcmH/NrfG